MLVAAWAILVQSGQHRLKSTQVWSMLGQRGQLASNVCFGPPARVRPNLIGLGPISSEICPDMEQPACIPRRCTTLVPERKLSNLAQSASTPETGMRWALGGGRLHRAAHEVDEGVGVPLAAAPSEPTANQPRLQCRVRQVCAVLGHCTQHRFGSLWPVVRLPCGRPSQQARRSQRALLPDA